jgi:hypothetical protein
VKLAVPHNDAYSLRVYDVAIYQRLVYFLFQLKRLHVAIADVSEFRKAHPDWSTHPVDAMPFSLDPGNARTRREHAWRALERAAIQRDIALRARSLLFALSYTGGAMTTTIQGGP